MATIELYKDKINSMSNYIEQAKNAVSDFCVDLSALKSKILGINSSVCDNVVSSISSSSQTQEQQIAGLEATQKEDLAAAVRRSWLLAVCTPFTRLYEDMIVIGCAVLTAISKPFR